MGSRCIQAGDGLVFGVRVGCDIMILTLLTNYDCSGASLVMNI